MNAATNHPPSLESIDIATFNMLQEWIDQANRPATDEQLVRIWPPWNELPAEMLPEEKRRILTLDEPDDLARNSRRLQEFQDLRRKFAYLPLTTHEYNQALRAAIRWSSLLRFHDTTVRLHKDLVTRQWAFAEADSQASGRIAIFRAAKELE